MDRAHRERGALRRHPCAIRVIALLVAVASLLTGTGCGASSDHGLTTATPVVRAAYVTTRGPGYRFAMTLTIGLPEGHGGTGSAEGSIDERDFQGDMTFRIKGKSFSSIFKKPYFYVRAPLDGSASSTRGKPWLRVNMDVYTEAFAANNPLGGDGNSPRQLIGFLKAAGQATDLGTEAVRGVATTHYHALVDVGRYAGTLPPGQRPAAERYASLLRRVTGTGSLPIDVWVDSTQRVRRLSTQLRFCTAEGTATVSMTMDLYDYGPQPAVLAPPDAEVSDVTDKVREGIAKGLEQLHC